MILTTPICSVGDVGAAAELVRVCTMGDSVEFCGGTHVANTAQIGVVKIISESSVAAGVRRIEAATGMGVLELLDNAEGVINAVASEFKAAGQAEVVAKAQAVAKELKAQSREIESLQAQIANSKTKELFEHAVSVKGLRYIHAVLKDTAADSLRTLGDQVKADAPDVVAVFAASNEGKSSVLAVCGADAVKAGAHAGKLIKEITAQLGGKGGGRPDSAMGGVADLLQGRGGPLRRTGPAGRHGQIGGTPGEKDSHRPGRRQGKRQHRAAGQSLYEGSAGGRARGGILSR